MARPRKSFRPSNRGKSIEVQLIPIPVRSHEDEQRLEEAQKLIAHFIGLGRARKLRKAEKEKIHDAA